MVMALIDVVLMVLQLVQILVITSVIVSWVGADPNNQIVQVIRATTEPIFRPVRILTSRIPGPLDWSPIIVLLIIEFVRRVIVYSVH